MPFILFLIPPLHMYCDMSYLFYTYKSVYVCVNALLNARLSFRFRLLPVYTYIHHIYNIHVCMCSKHVCSGGGVGEYTSELLRNHHEFSAHSCDQHFGRSSVAFLSVCTALRTERVRNLSRQHFVILILSFNTHTRTCEA